MTYHVAPYLSGFIGGGWAVIAPAYNVGVELRPKTERRVSPFLVGKIRDASHSMVAALWLLGGALVASGLLVLVPRLTSQPRRSEG